jgi:NADPH:quinone reductase-like Zn-dependent oxidoreductase
MKAVQLRKLTENPLDLKVEQVPEPKCPADGMLVEVRAVGLNYFDALQIAGWFERAGWRDSIVESDLAVGPVRGTGKYQYRPNLVSFPYQVC